MTYKSKNNSGCVIRPEVTGHKIKRTDEFIPKSPCYLEKKENLASDAVRL